MRECCKLVAAVREINCSKAVGLKMVVAVCKYWCFVASDVVARYGARWLICGCFVVVRELQCVLVGWRCGEYNWWARASSS